MKKPAVVWVVAGLIIVALAIGFYFLVRTAGDFYSTARDFYSTAGDFYSTAGDFYEDYAEVASIPALNEQIRNQTEYRPPADQRMTASQAERYVTVQRAMAQTLGNRFEELDKKYDQLTRSLNERGREPGLADLMTVWTDIMSLLTDAKRAQVDALNKTNLSLSEYQWIRRKTLEALGHGGMTFNFEALLTDPARVVSVPDPQTIDPRALEHNRALLEPHEDSMEEWLVFSFFGL